MRRVLDFLGELRVNNNREWFADNKMRYREADAVVNDFAEQLLAGIGEFDESVRGLTLREITYRLYRDTRFSHDKTPYKTHFGVYVCPGGKKSNNGGYYFHIEPKGEDRAAGAEGNAAGVGETGDGMIGSHLLDVGIFMPPPEVLRSVRDEIFDNGEAVMAAMARARKAGFELDRSNSLKRTPKGYPLDSEWDEYLKLKDFHISKVVDNDYILAPDLARRAVEDFRTAHDFMTLMYRAARFALEG